MTLCTKRNAAGLVALAGVVCAVGIALRHAEKPRAAAASEPSTKADWAGFSGMFDAELKKIGQISPTEFRDRYQINADYLQELTWDPTTAKFWDKVMLNPDDPDAEVRARGQSAVFANFLAQSQGKKMQGEPMLKAKGMYDFRPNAAELALFKKNGFVVSERLGAASPTDMYYRIYARDLPVFITCDSILHAWHRSYDSMLEDVEVNLLVPSLTSILANMAAQISEAKKQYGQGTLEESLSDADFFIGVALTFLTGGTGANLSQGERVEATIKAANALQMQEYNLFGRKRDVDFSQFKPRGHYEKSEQLKRYFKAMMWCGRIDLRIAGTPDLASPRELGGAIVLHDLLRRSGKFDEWRQFDAILQTFVGKTDSMTFAQMGEFLTKAGIASPANVQSLDKLTALQKEIMTGKFGLQQICGDVFYVNLHDPDKLELPRSFTVMGQKFVVDSWVLSKIVYDDVIWDDKKVMRRIPSCLDAAFAALGNNQIIPLLTACMQNPAGREFRDGLNYQHSLAAARNTIEALKPAAWEENLYTSWIGTLRELSQPTTDKKYPESMRTQTWAMKTLNSQLASWTQLRHDTILYAKQSYTEGVQCYYPAGFVEPLPEFWIKMEKMARRGAELFAKAQFPGQGQQLLQAKPRYADFLEKFAKTMGILKDIAVKELAQQELTKEETKFLEDVVEVDRGCGGPPRYSGWYPGLFFEGSAKCAIWDALVADVHTDVPSPDVGDPGCVLHQGVGNIDLLLIAIDNGKDRMVYAGPVLSHYEFEMPGVSRKSDSEWQLDVNHGKLPPRPEWTRGYLAPGVNPEAKNYKVEKDR